MASREDRAKLRAAHEQKLKQMAAQPVNHATFDEPIPTPKAVEAPEKAEIKVEAKVEEVKAPEVKAPVKPAKKEAPKKIETVVETVINQSKSTPVASDTANIVAESKKKREELKNDKVKALAKYNDGKKTVKIVATEENIRYWIKQSRKNGIPQQDFAALIFLDTIEAVKNGQITDESEEVQEYQKVLHNMGTPVNAQISISLVDEIKDAAAELCMKQSGFFAYSLNRARLNNK